jgi:formate hydrogenlyase transcriptional activator
MSWEPGTARYIGKSLATSHLEVDMALSSVDRDRHLDVLRRVTEHMAVGQRLDEVLVTIAEGLVELAGYARASVWLLLTDEECDTCREKPPAMQVKKVRLHRFTFSPEVNKLEPAVHAIPISPAFIERINHDRRPLLLNELAQWADVIAEATVGTAIQPSVPEIIGALSEAGLKGGVGYPLFLHDQLMGFLLLWSRQEISEEESRFLEVFALQAASVIRSAQLYREVERLKDQLELENTYLEEAVREEGGFADVVGRSPALRSVLRLVQQVAPTDSTALLIGETGTGKELVARAIHAGSLRAKHPMIKVNCGAISPTLVESELFGHEKGAFTGALQRRIGRFELANHGTIFLDEVGELGPETQVKLLRVLQEREFERVGGERPIQVDVRVIAATHRDLQKDMASGRFRPDLFFRLNVVPIVVPPLRERIEDLPALAAHFVAHFARTLRKPLTGISRASLSRLERYSWPGNIRELQNLIERACVLAPGGVVDVPDPAASVPPADEFTEEEAETLAAFERQHLVRILEQTSWRIEGPGGAADRLGLRPSTLRSRLHKLGVRRPVPTGG